MTKVCLPLAHPVSPKRNATSIHLVNYKVRPTQAHHVLRAVLERTVALRGGVDALAPRERMCAEVAYQWLGVPSRGRGSSNATVSVGGATG